MRNALVLGGTGMLAGLSLALLQDGFAVFVVGRRAERFAPMLEAAEGLSARLTPMAVDYHDTARLGRWIAQVQLMHGPLDLVVAWIHGPAESVLHTVIDEVERYRQMPWALYHVMGHHALSQPEKPPMPSSLCQYRPVILGWSEEDGVRRWLTHEEICMGVYAAVKAERGGVVGQMTPDSHDSPR